MQGFTAPCTATGDLGSAFSERDARAFVREFRLVKAGKQRPVYFASWYRY